MQRYEYFIKRLLLIVPTFLGITMLCFVIVHLVPGGPVEQAVASTKAAMGGEGGHGGGGGGKNQSISPEQMQRLQEYYGFDKPLPQRYWQWLWTNRLGLAGKSWKWPENTVWEVIASRFPVSLIFGISGFLLGYLVCIPLGIAKALRDGSAFDVGSSVLVFVGYAIPGFALGMLLKTLFCGTSDHFWDLFPYSGWHTVDGWALMGTWARIKDVCWHMALPLLCESVGSFAVLTVLMKNSLLEQVGSDYIRTVLAKGASRRRAIWGHALRNSLIPIATGIGSILTVMFAGSVLLEYVFNIDGMGRLSLTAIQGHDYPVFLGIVALTSILNMLGNIVQDISYVLIDPRINFESQ